MAIGLAYISKVHVWVKLEEYDNTACTFNERSIYTINVVYIYIFLNLRYIFRKSVQAYVVSERGS